MISPVPRIKNRKANLRRNRLRPSYSVMENSSPDPKCFQDIHMDEVKDFKNSDFGYGNEIPDFLGFMENKQPYWSVISKKLFNKQEKRSLMDYIRAKEGLTINTGDRRKSNLERFVKRSHENKSFLSFAYSPTKPLVSPGQHSDSVNASFRRTMNFSMMKEKISRTKIYDPRRLDILCSTPDIPFKKHDSLNFDKKNRAIRMNSTKLDSRGNFISQLQNEDQNSDEFSALQNKIKLENALIKDEKKYNTLSKNLDKMDKEYKESNKILANIAGKRSLPGSPRKLKQKQSFRASSLNLGLQTIQENNCSIRTQLLLPKLNKSSRNIFTSSEIKSPEDFKFNENMLEVGYERGKRNTVIGGNMKPKRSANMLSLCFSSGKRSSMFLSNSPKKSSCSRREIEGDQNCANILIGNKNFNLTQVDFENLCESSEERSVKVQGADWYLKGKMKFIAKRIFCHKFDPEREYDVKALEEGLCKSEKCRKCSPFKEYIKILKKYQKKTDMKDRSKIMIALSNMENRLVVPGKYRLTEISKLSKKRARISPPCLIKKPKSPKKKGRLSSTDTMNQTKETKATLKGDSQDISISKPKSKGKCLICTTQAASKNRTCKHHQKLIVNLKSKKKNCGFLYAKGSLNHPLP